MMSHDEGTLHQRTKPGHSRSLPRNVSGARVSREGRELLFFFFFILSIDVNLVPSHCTSVRRGSRLLPRSFPVSVCLSRRRYRDRCAGIAHCSTRCTEERAMSGERTGSDTHITRVRVIRSDVWRSADAETYSC